VLIAIVLCAAGFALALQKGFAWIGGALSGAAISALHDIGMAAVKLPADAVGDRS
jgi:NO-binding membrane sensor protein with MHYT domain